MYEKKVDDRVTEKLDELVKVRKLVNDRQCSEALHRSSHEPLRDIAMFVECVVTEYETRQRLQGTRNKRTWPDDPAAKHLRSQRVIVGNSAPEQIAVRFGVLNKAIEHCGAKSRLALPGRCLVFQIPGRQWQEFLCVGNGVANRIKAIVAMRRQFRPRVLVVTFKRPDIVAAHVWLDGLQREQIPLLVRSIDADHEVLQAVVSSKSLTGKLHAQIEFEQRVTVSVRSRRRLPPGCVELEKEPTLDRHVGIEHLAGRALREGHVARAVARRSLI